MSNISMKFFEKIKHYGLKLSSDECKIFSSKIMYLEQIIDSKGRKLDPSRLSAIKKMSAPTNVSTLQAFLGLANYCSNFIPNMHILNALLNKLLKKDSK